MFLPKPFSFMFVYFVLSLSTPLLFPCRSRDSVQALADG